MNENQEGVAEQSYKNTAPRIVNQLAQLAEGPDYRRITSNAEAIDKMIESRFGRKSSTEAQGPQNQSKLQ